MCEDTSLENVKKKKFLVKDREDFIKQKRDKGGKVN